MVSPCRRGSFKTEPATGRRSFGASVKYFFRLEGDWFVGLIFLLFFDGKFHRTEFEPIFEEFIFRKFSRKENVIMVIIKTIQPLRSDS